MTLKILEFGGAKGQKTIENPLVHWDQDEILGLGPENHLFLPVEIVTLDQTLLRVLIL